MNVLAKVAVALLAGFVVLVALFPASGAAVWCYSLIGYPVPCGNGNLAAGAATAGAVGLALWVNDPLPKVAPVLVAGLLVLVLVFPWGGGVDGGLDAFPPTCFGMFGLYTVPCGRCRWCVYGRCRRVVPLAEASNGVTGRLSPRRVPGHLAAVRP